MGVKRRCLRERWQVVGKAADKTSKVAEYNSPVKENDLD